MENMAASVWLAPWRAYFCQVPPLPWLQICDLPLLQHETRKSTDPLVHAIALLKLSFVRWSTRGSQARVDRKIKAWSPQVFEMLVYQWSCQRHHQSSREAWSHQCIHQPRWTRGWSWCQGLPGHFWKIPDSIKLGVCLSFILQVFASFLFTGYYACSLSYPRRICKENISPYWLCTACYPRTRDGLRATSFVMAYRKVKPVVPITWPKPHGRQSGKFFTSRRCPPRGWTGPRPKLEAGLLRKFSNGVEACQWLVCQWLVCPWLVCQFVNDWWPFHHRQWHCLLLSMTWKEMAGIAAAADQMKAVLLTRYTRLKNIKVCVRDGAHAAGRCLSCNMQQWQSRWIMHWLCMTIIAMTFLCFVQVDAKWYAIPVPQEVWTKYIWSCSSVISLIYHWPQNARIFRKYVTWLNQRHRTGFLGVWDTCPTKSNFPK